MALNKYATIRYRVIDRLIRSKSHPFPSKEKLRRSCEEELFGSTQGDHISISTIEKDLWALKNESSLGYAPIAYNKGENGYYYTQKDFSLDLPLSEDDIELIRLATSTLSQFKDSQVFQDLEMAIDKIQGRLKVYKQIGDEKIKHPIRFERAPFYSGSIHLSFLLGAIQDQKEIQISYTPFSDNIERTFPVQPYFLQEHKNRWYLICFDKQSLKFRTLGLDRMTKIDYLGTSFVPDEGFNPDEYYRYSFGIGIYSGEAVEIRLSFNRIQGKYIKSQPIHPTQEIIEEREDQLIVSVRLIPSPEFFMFLLGFGANVEVLHPKSIQEELIKRSEETLKLYSK